MPETTLAALLLPPNRSALESAVAQTLHTRTHPERTIATLHQPGAAGGIAAPLLPWLAWGVDVLAWPRTAVEAQRRQLTAASWRMHRQMGTLAGMREIAGVFGASIQRAIVPPAKTFLGAPVSVAQRNAFLARYPQLRVYPNRRRGQRVGAMLRGLLPGHAAFPVQTDAALRLMPQAFLWQDGHETALQAMEREVQKTGATALQVLEVRMPGTALHRSFCGQPVRWITPSDAAHRMYRLQLDVPYIDSREVLHRTAVQPGLGVIDVRYEMATEPGIARGLFAGRHVLGHLVHSTAADRIFKRMHLFDPTVSVARRGASSFCDATRLTMPAHHAELAVRMRGTAHPRQAGRYVRGFLIASDRAAYHDTMSAMRNVARSSDRIAIDSAVTRPFTAGMARLAGTAYAGEWRDAIA